MGARIKGVGTDTIKIEGVEKLKGVSHHVIPDRIEAGTFMVGAVMTRGNVLIKNVVPDHLKAVIAKLRECGADITMTDEGLVARGDVNPIVSTDVKTLPYPGFPTDMQSPFMALDRGEGSERGNRNSVEKPFHACWGIQSYGRQHQDRWELCHHPG